MKIKKSKFLNIHKIIIVFMYKAENEKEITIMNEEGNTYKYHKIKDKNINEEKVIYKNEDYPEEINTWIEENTNYIFAEDATISYPIKFADFVYLKDKLNHKFELFQNKFFEKNIDFNFDTLDMDSVDVRMVWEIDENGGTSLVKVEYGDTVLTPEKEV